MFNETPQNVRYFSLSIRTSAPCEKSISKIVSRFQSSLRDLYKEHHSTALMIIQSVNIFGEANGQPIKTATLPLVKLPADEYRRNGYCGSLIVSSQGEDQISCREYQEMGCQVEVREYAQRITRSTYKEFR